MAAVTAVKVRDKDTQSAVSVTCNGTSSQFVVHKRQLETYLDKLGLLAYANGTVSVLVSSYTEAGSLQSARYPVNNAYFTNLQAGFTVPARNPTPTHSEELRVCLKV